MNGKHLLVCLLCSLATAAWAETNAWHFGIFMPREDVAQATPDVAERIQMYYRTPPRDIPLAKFPLISDQDILSYDWKTHRLAVKPEALSRVRRPSVRGAPFVVVAEGEPVYVGAFYTAVSSLSCPVPVILVDGITRTNLIRIDRAYPGELPGQSGKDPRPDSRIKKALQAAGKLKE